MLGLSRREWIVAAGIIIADRLTKVYAKAVRPDSLLFSYAENTGAGFGSFQGHNTLLALVAVLALVLVYLALRSVEEYTPGERVGLAVLGAGILGNLWDRVQYGFVVDFIAVFASFDFPIFNIADAAITLSVAYLLVQTARTWYAARTTHKTEQLNRPMHDKNRFKKPKQAKK